MQNILNAFVQYLVTFIVFLGVAFAGAFCGKKIRDNKTEKSDKEEK